MLSPNLLTAIFHSSSANANLKKKTLSKIICAIAEYYSVQKILFANLSVGCY